MFHLTISHVFMSLCIVGANNLMPAFGWGAGAEITGNGKALTELTHAEARSNPPGRN